MIKMYITTLPVILAGVLNMVIVKQRWFIKRAKPINKNMFGVNKTWLGIITMVICSIITHVSIWSMCDFYKYSEIYKDTLIKNIEIGLFMGLAYMICELPNSYLKRKQGIPSGKKGKGLKGIIFFILDYIDSMFGIALVIKIYGDISNLAYMNYIILGGITHLLINIILYLLKIKKEI